VPVESGARASAHTLDASAAWNRPYLKQHHCARLKANLQSDPHVRYADGDPVGDGYTIPRSPAFNPDSGEHGCDDGDVRLDITEALPRDAHGPHLYFHKGGQGYLPSSVPYGHVPRGVLEHPPEPRFTKERIDSHGADPGHNPLPGAGRAHPRVLRAYLVRPLPIGVEGALPWLYKPGEPGARYTKYGDAGPVNGAGTEHFAYLCWSWMRQNGRDGAIVSGGGAIRTILRSGQAVERCGVKAITSAAFDRDSKRVGGVVAIYARVRFGDDSLYGWMVHSHLIPTAGGFNRVMHLDAVESVSDRAADPDAELLREEALEEEFVPEGSLEDW
jgi:hypothetical protein